MTIQKINKNTVKKSIRDNGSWTGYIAPSEVNPYHINNGWHIGVRVTLNSIVELNDVCENYAYHNCNKEMGYTVSCYQDK